MEHLDRKEHWDNIYQTKDLKDVSWYQPTPIIEMKEWKGNEMEFSLTKRGPDVKM